MAATETEIAGNSASLSNEIENEYHFQPFPKDGDTYIRIATIYPGKHDDDIRISLQHRRFHADNKPFYEALSYVWGSPEGRPTHIFVESAQDGVPSQGWLPARTNLVSALRHLRYLDRPRDLWVDAICINQNDAAEKGPQVAMMGSLFAAAPAVLVWFGPAADESDRALAIVRHLGSQVDVDWDTYTFRSSEHSQEKTIADPEQILNLDEEDMCAIYHLFCRDWFDRLWIRQEIFLADQSAAIVVCGSISIPWKIFRSAWLLIRRKPRPDFQYAQDLNSRLFALGGFLYQYPEAWLSTVREDFAGSECSDPRDRIYGIRGMLEESVRSAIKTDYTKSVVDVYRDAMLAHSKAVNNLEILGQCQYSPTWSGPSWVPDWSSDKQHSPALDLRMASGMLRAPWKVDSGELLVTGVVVATVLELRQLIPNSASPGHQLMIPEAVYSLFQKEPRSLEEPYPSGGTVLDAYVRTLCNDVFRDNHDTPNGYQQPRYDTAKEIILQFKEGSLDQRAAKVESHKGAEFTKLLDRLSHACRGRLFLRTKDNLFGLAPHPAKPGDEICIVLGCRQLLLLRRINENQHIVVGECYLCDHSHGEAILGALLPHIKTTWTPVNSGSYAEVFEDCVTGVRMRQDPRLRDLDVDLTTFQKKLDTEKCPYLDINVDEINTRLGSQGIHTQSFRLV